MVHAGGCRWRGATRKVQVPHGAGAASPLSSPGFNPSCSWQNKGDKDNGWTEDGWGTAIYNATSKSVELMPK